jgi:hypothetical protein
MPPAGLPSELIIRPLAFEAPCAGGESPRIQRALTITAGRLLVQKLRHPFHAPSTAALPGGEAEPRCDLSHGALPLGYFFGQSSQGGAIVFSSRLAVWT